MSQAQEPLSDHGFGARNRRVARILVTVMAVLAVLALLAGVRW
jgi:hypothetical protein